MGGDPHYNSECGGCCCDGHNHRDLLRQEASCPRRAHRNETARRYTH